MKINLEGYEITGTSAEMLELLDLLAEEVAAVEEPAPETPEAPAPKKAAKPTGKKPGGKKLDWGRAMALRKAGWSYKAIGEELGCADVTVAAHLKPLE